MLLCCCCAAVAAAAAEFNSKNVAQVLKVTFDTLPTQICMRVCATLKTACLSVDVCVCDLGYLPIVGPTQFLIV